MEKQTAVEWLVKEISEILGPLNTKPMQDLLIVDAINQAKAMEKEQIIKARNNGFLASGEGWNGEYGIKDLEEIKSEQYYKETYESND